MVEGYGGAVRCFNCVTVSAIPSASPIKHAFNKQVASAQEAMDVRSSVPTIPGSIRAKSKVRDTQRVNSVVERVRVIKWIEEHGVQKGVFAAAARAHSDVVGRNLHNATMKVTRWWKERESIKEATRVSVTQVQEGMKKRFYVKAASGRGPKPADWIIWIYQELELEFRRMQRLGVKLSFQLIAQIARYILAASTGPFTTDTILEGRTLASRIDTSWVQRFCVKKNIVMRVQSGKLKVSLAKEEEIARNIAEHLGEVKFLLSSGKVAEDMVSNMDETHMLFDMDNKRCLGFRGQESMTYLDVVGGGEGMTLIVKLRGGSNPRIEPAMLVFQNANCSYPIAGVKDDVEGITYRSGPKGWMDKRVFKEWIESDMCNPVGSGDAEWIFMDNAGGHKAAEDLADLLQERKKKVKFLPANSTHLTQPADSFIIQMIKQEWRTQWEEKKLDLVNKSAFKQKPKNGSSWSGKLLNPGKSFYLQLAAHCVEKVSAARDEDGISLVRKAMIRCGLAKNLNGVWEEQQLKPELQAIIDLYREDFTRGYNQAAMLEGPSSVEGEQSV
ncbi:hypothetical protein P43SY_004356 [Pythium insidiosum]|uniref:DDE-1 domain-containing protein n=1 Tax=Pythium insidiosum TaxID=114742 RepID=A0AAD5LJZ7_PYTIN|nr:hypothetical protein P43SY_004356 [Pythium insidiosum]